MTICRYTVVTNVRTVEITSDGSPTVFTNARCSAQGNSAIGWAGKNDLVQVFGAYTNYCAYPDEQIVSIHLIECQEPPSVQYDCINGACIPKTTYNTPGIYQSLSDCEVACGTGCSGKCISNSGWAQIEGLSDELESANCG